MDELKINWTGSPLPNSKQYVVKVNSTDAKLIDLQSKVGVIDFPNIDDDVMSTLPAARKTKDSAIRKATKLTTVSGETVKQFINRVAQCEGNFDWDKDKLFVPDEV